MITKGQKINDRYEIIRSIGEGGTMFILAMIQF